jgi:ABC-type sugar transport system ATPase subunit
VEPAGSEAFVHLTLAGGELLVARVASEERPRADEAVRVAVAREDVHLFDGETGQRVEWTT